MTLERRELPDRRHPPRLAPPRCPICRTTPKPLVDAGVVVPVTETQYVRQTGLKSSDEVRFCFKCCDVVMCAVKTRRAA